MQNYFDKSALEAALAYSRWLHRVKFIEWTNSKMAEVGLPPETLPICLNTIGERVYMDIRAQVRSHRGSQRGAIQLDGAERRAVVNEILDRLHRVQR